jgi:hypothetical protein
MFRNVQSILIGIFLATGIVLGTSCVRGSDAAVTYGLVEIPCFADQEKIMVTLYKGDEVPQAVDNYLKREVSTLELLSLVEQDTLNFKLENNLPLIARFLLMCEQYGQKNGA